MRADAKAAGIVNTVVAPGEVEAEAMKAAREIAALPPQGVLTARRLMRGSRDEIVARMRRGSGTDPRAARSPEARAAFEAFLTRKKA